MRELGVGTVDGRMVLTKLRGVEVLEGVREKKGGLI